MTKGTVDKLRQIMSEEIEVNPSNLDTAMERFKEVFATLSRGETIWAAEILIDPEGGRFGLKSIRREVAPRGGD